MGRSELFAKVTIGKHFKMPKAAKGKVVRIEFEGAMYNTHIWVNGQKVGERPYGYIGFE